MTKSHERRRHTRRDVHIHATAVDEKGLPRVSALIHNVSTSGAKVELLEEAHLPDRFYMLIPQHELQPCELVWRSGQFIGVAYRA